MKTIFAFTLCLFACGAFAQEGIIPTNTSEG